MKYRQEVLEFLYTVAYPAISLEKAEKWKPPVEKKEPQDKEEGNDDIEDALAGPAEKSPKKRVKPKKSIFSSKKFQKTAPKDIVLPTIDSLMAEKLQNKN